MTQTTVEPTAAAPTWVVVEPQIVFVRGIIRSKVTFRAKGRGTLQSVRARFRTGDPIEVSRGPDKDGWAYFVVELFTLPSYEGSDNAIFQVQIVSDYDHSNSVFVSVTPHTHAIVAQAYPTGRIAAARVVSRDQRLSFGKYKGRKYSDVALEEPGWLKWMMREGAGSTIERQCAALALDLEIDHLPPTRRASALAIASSTWRIAEPSQETSPLLLADPDAKKGLWGSLRRLLK